MEPIQKTCKICEGVLTSPTGNYKRVTCSAKCSMVADEAYKQAQKIKLNERRRVSTISKFIDAHPDEYVECKLCGMQATSIARHVYTHGLTVDEYKAKYNAEVICQTRKDSIKGEKNPGYQHGGKFSAFSDKFLKYDGLTEEEKAQKIRETADAAKETKAANPQNESTRIEYYLSKGMSQREAELALSDRQRTFSLEVCIKKHGEKEGRRIWKERQSKWIGVMNSKSPEEIQDINRRKAINTNYGLIDSDLYVNIKGLFYMVSLPNDLLKFGITSRRMDQRYTKKQMDGCEVVYTMEGDLDLIAKLECLVKHDFSDKTITLAEQHGVFGFSETLRGVSAMNWQTTLNQNQKTTY